VGTPQTLSQCLEEAVADGLVRAVVLKGVAGSARDAALTELSSALAPRGVRVDVTDCSLHGGFAWGCADSLLRARLGLAVDASRSALDEAVARATEDEVVRAFLLWALGVRDPALKVGALDSRSRDEGVVGEVGRLITATAPWVWVLDDAAAADLESVQLLEWLTARSGTGVGAMVVLALSAEDASRLEPRVKALRLGDRYRELALRPVLVPVEPASPPSAQSASLLTILRSCGGRLPVDALEPALNAPFDVSLSELQAAGLVRCGPTRRFPSGEVLVVEGAMLGAAPAPVAPDVRARLTAWAEARLEVYDCRPLVVALASDDATRGTLAWELAARCSSTWRDQVRAAAQPQRGATSLADAGARRLEALRRAQHLASGVRRLVLARQVSEEELFRGDGTRAAATAQAALRAASVSPLTLSEPWRAALLGEVDDELERWDQLSLDEAVASLELARAEAVCQLGVARDTLAAFAAVRVRLERLPRSRVRSSLWIRVARTLVWFQAEMLGDPAGARAVCEQVRAQASPGELEQGVWAIAFLRAEEIAAARSGDRPRARQLADDLVRVSQERRDTREVCVALNTRSLMHLRDGELVAAHRGFEQSLELARSIGFKRREAVALHNLGLVQGLRGEYAASVTCQERYLELSEAIGNQAARGYAPAALAMVQVQLLDFARAEANLTRARKAAEDAGWPAILAWTRHLSGLVRLGRWCQKRDSLTLSLARTDFLACLDLLADRKSGWSEELDPAETAAALGVCALLGNNAAQATRAVAEGARFEADSAVSARHLEALREVCERRRPVAALTWFEERGQVRALEQWTKWLSVLQPAS
jgi:tetratricopeptide (TPR) repeat protein